MLEKMRDGKRAIIEGHGFSIAVNQVET
jgi:hypothetical protein